MLSIFIAKGSTRAGFVADYRPIGSRGLRFSAKRGRLTLGPGLSRRCLAGKIAPVIFRRRISRPD
jgi:hypothetical protein